MRILCLGNNTEHTDYLTRKLADDTCWGLLSELPNNSIDYSEPGYYHSSVFDIMYGKLLNLAAEFDQVVILDQTKESYGHPDAYYKTICIGKQLSNVVWQNPTMPNSIRVFEELVHINPSFCIFPFIELMTNNDHTTVCCRSSQPVTKVSELVNYNTDPAYQAIRNKMLAGEKIPEHCQACYHVESMGMISARQQETVEWANRLGLNSVQDVKNIEHPVYYEVRPSNICNLQCRTCGPINSELLNQEYVKIGIIKQPIHINYSGFDIVDLDHVKKLYVSGGEPTATLEFFDFVNQCITNNKVFDFTVNTNGTKLSDKFKQQLKQLPHMQFIVSIDGYQRLNDYIRWPSNWDTIISNVKYLVDQKHYVSFNTTVSMYNIAELYSLLEFFDQEFPGILVHCQMAEGPTSPLNFPDSNIVVSEAVKIRNLNCYKNDQLLSSFIEGLIAHFTTRTTLDYQAIDFFKTTNQLIDSNRGVNLCDYSPRLWQTLQKL